MKLMVLLVLGGLFVGGGADGQTADAVPKASPSTPAPRAALRQACAADVRALCAGQRGREAIVCLRQQADKVSGACQDALAKMRRSRLQSRPEA